MRKYIRSLFCVRLSRCSLAAISEETLNEVPCVEILVPVWDVAQSKDTHFPYYSVLNHNRGGNNPVIGFPLFTFPFAYVSVSYASIKSNEYSKIEVHLRDREVKIRVGSPPGLHLDSA